MLLNEYFDKRKKKYKIESENLSRYFSTFTVSSILFDHSNCSGFLYLYVVAYSSSKSHSANKYFGRVPLYVHEIFVSGFIFVSHFFVPSSPFQDFMQIFAYP